MSTQLTFTPGSTAEQQLLAISVVLLDALRRHGRIELRIPEAVHQALPASSYGQLLYDTLAAEHTDLEDRLRLRVHPSVSFELIFNARGES